MKWSCCADTRWNISHTRTTWLKCSGAVIWLLCWLSWKSSKSSRFRSSLSTAAPGGFMDATKCLWAYFVFACSYWETALAQGPVGMSFSTCSTWIHMQLLSLLQHCRCASVTTLWGSVLHIFKNTYYRTLLQIKAELIRGFCSISICCRCVRHAAEAYEWFVFTARQNCLFMQLPQQQVINSK